MRRLLYCGEWIESHALHIYLLHAPDFLGYDGAIEMAADHRDLVERGLGAEEGRQRADDAGRRARRPPGERARRRLLPAARPAPSCSPCARSCSGPSTTRSRPCGWVAGFDFPDFEQTQEYVALRSPHGYPLEGGSVVSSTGRAFDVARVRGLRPSRSTSRAPTPCTPGSTGRPRTSWGRWRATRSTRTSCPTWPARRARDAGLGAECRNPFRSIIVRAVELVYALDEAMRIIDGWHGAPEPAVAVPPARGGRATAPPRRRAGCSTTGTSWPTTARSSTRSSCRPTSQNLASIEEDLRRFVAGPAAPRPRRADRCAASRPSATTTRASRAPPTSST